MATARPARTSAAPSRWLRIVLPLALVLVWLAAGSIGGPYFGKIDEVSSNDQTVYLPESAEATKVAGLLKGFQAENVIPAVVVVASEQKLQPAQLQQITTNVQVAGKLDVVNGTASPPIPSEDGLAVQVFVPLDSTGDLDESVEELREQVAKDLPEGLSVHVTGPAGFSADLVEAFAGIDGLLLGVALAAVLVILLVVYRSILVPLSVLATSMFALCVALLANWWLAKSGALMLNGQIQGILFILVIGAATDYSLLYVARYREALVHEQSTWRATVTAWKGSIEPIVAAGGTVIAGLLCLLFSDLRSNSGLGPVAAIGIAFSMLAALTLLPALLLLLGRRAFWPRVPRYDPEAASAEDRTSGFWARLSAWVAKHPRPIWIITVLVLLGGCLGVGQLRADGVPQSDLVVGTSQARDGQQVLGEHFDAGSGTPVQVITRVQQLQQDAKVMLDTPGIASVQVVTDKNGSTATVTEQGIKAGRGGPATPLVVEGNVLLQGTLSEAPDSSAAAETVQQLRQNYRDHTSFDHTGALVGGTTATSVDTNQASIHDRSVIIPMVLLVILVILMVLLRSVLAPVLLVATTVLSFGFALGVSALVFNHLFHFPGADPVVPLYGFVFLVALGIDYNIFLMSRVREESLHHGTRTGMQHGLQITGGIITSAGLVLAATFTALVVIPILFLVQLAFIVAFGVLLDTFVVRSLLVPALTQDIGRAIWWPSALSRRPEASRTDRRNQGPRRLARTESATKE